MVMRKFLIVDDNLALADNLAEIISDADLGEPVLAEGGALIFNPTSNGNGFGPGVDSQAKGVFVYGGGADYSLSRHFLLRAEYRGLVYKTPDFGLAALHTDATTHTAQPSAGIVFRF